VAGHAPAASAGQKAAIADVQGLRLWCSPVSEATAHISVLGETHLATVGKLRDAIAGALAERPERRSSGVFVVEAESCADAHPRHLRSRSFVRRDRVARAAMSTISRRTEGGRESVVI
jgi:hypothetical protein